MVYPTKVTELKRLSPHANFAVGVPSHDGTGLSAGACGGWARRGGRPGARR
jgi:hypothetical protein